jgi:YesN/AraC family two-component response regulator
LKQSVDLPDPGRPHSYPLFTDVIMPGRLNGYDLASEVIQRWPQTKIVPTSGFPETRAAESPQPQNFSLLSKPYRKEDLARVLRATLAP